MSEKSSLNRTLISLMIFYVFALLFALLASATILLHVNPYSKCLLYSSHIGGGELSYGNYASKFDISLRDFIQASNRLIRFRKRTNIEILNMNSNFRLHDGRLCVPWSNFRCFISFCKIVGRAAPQIRPCSGTVRLIDFCKMKKHMI